MWGSIIESIRALQIRGSATVPEMLILLYYCTSSPTQAARHVLNTGHHRKGSVAISCQKIGASPECCGKMRTTFYFEYLLHNKNENKNVLSFYLVMNYHLPIFYIKL